MGNKGSKIRPPRGAVVHAEEAEEEVFLAAEEVETVAAERLKAPNVTPEYIARHRDPTHSEEQALRDMNNEGLFTLAINGSYYAMLIIQERIQDKKISSVELESFVQALQTIIAADPDNAALLRNLAFCHYNGIGMKENHENAATLYNSAHKRGDIQASREMGVLYIHGRGVDKDFTIAARYLIHASNRGDAEAMALLAFMSRVGDYVPENYEDIVALCKCGDKLGNPRAVFELALCHRYGSGVPLNYDKAVGLYRGLIKRGSVSAIVRLSHCYASGNGVPRNYTNPSIA